MVIILDTLFERDITSWLAKLNIKDARACGVLMDHFSGLKKLMTLLYPFENRTVDAA
jgi:hypothetical protein